MFQREHHRRIARVLEQLDGELLRRHHCLFGGGTAIALLYGEFRESVDLDFLVSDREGYRGLRQSIRRQSSLKALWRTDGLPMNEEREPLADQYGIRARVLVDEVAVKFEIVLEGRIELASPSFEDQVCGITCLTLGDMACGKLLANSDRWNDDSVFNRDVLDLAHLPLSAPVLEGAIAKAEQAYGEAIRSDLEKALVRLKERTGWLDRCRQALAIEEPRALLWQKLSNLQRLAGKG
ncbi:nucleotidyl transferase AbiEii/AbiGii toxin family protein [Synechococcus sp. CS-205]|uniref:nucleotidyl transferase AbiEii/AbiGii toxin family protein n=1 Tax=Synechococcus sp. CS-205 TaxID=2847984 RepID=UPI00223AB4FD|nr:nucleotidyl transferase AbiEii/AbiGii toxin family protein [Synechococcus sp. CS-205]MCT0249259.1 nucleotidyl transferase AbiEii/AbiGii toxin family protein [Synechococcus sp. CS-205]